MVAIAARQAVSEDEYFELETEAEVRHEFCNGEVVEMPSALPSHNIIAGNFFAILNFLFRRHPYQAYITDQRLWIPEANRLSIPM
ncbi:MAG: Uma2 family endonuclease [Cyanophyceae cyanobacterium]